MFKSTGAPVVDSFDPRKYHAAENAPRGNPKRVMTRSDLHSFGKCPRKWVNGVPREASTALAWGSLFDCSVITSWLMDTHYIVRPDTYPSTDAKTKVMTEKPWHGASTWCKEWMESVEASGRTVISADDWSDVKAATARLLNEPELGPYVLSCRKSVLATAHWHDETGIIVPVKILVDLVPPDDSLADLKTTESADPESWERSVSKWGYDYQAAMYLDVWNAATGENRTVFRHVVSESKPPYEPAGRQLSEEFLRIGRAKYQRDMRRYCECLATGEWPGYNSGWLLTEPKPWMMTEE